MSNNKQSSVDWLVCQLKISTYWTTLIAELEFMDLEIDDIIQQAKAMHKDEILNCFNESWRLRDKPYATAEKYYNETFGGNNGK